MPLKKRTKKYIPFELVELEPNSYHILVNASINSSIVKLIVDTGASRSVIDKAFDSGIRVDGIEETSAIGFMSDRINVALSLIPELLIENLQFDEFPVAIADLSSLREVYLNITDLNIGGLLGSDFLVRNVSSINFSTKKIFIKNLRKYKTEH